MGLSMSSFRFNSLVTPEGSDHYLLKSAISSGDTISAASKEHFQALDSLNQSDFGGAAKIECLNDPDQPSIS